MTTPEELFADIDLAAREYDNHDFGLPYTTNEYGRGRDEIIQLLDAALNAARVDGLRWCRDLVNVRLPYHEALVAEIDTEIAALERGNEK